jgi:hypothetical protein
MNIYTAISGIMSEIGAISKDKKNQQQGFMYRGVDDVMNALQPLLVKHKVFVVPEILEQIREDRTSSKGNALIYSVCKIKYTFFTDDGSNIVAIVIGEGMDSGDKATNKAMAIAFKYACFQVFCIPTEEMKDPDGEYHDLKPQDKPQEKPLEKPQQSTKPTITMITSIGELAQRKGIDLKAKGVEWTKKSKSTQWTMEDYNNVKAKLEELEDRT